ncbi:MAG: type II secretion system protein GspL [Rudaea sp.]
MPDRLLLRLSADGSMTWLTQDASGRALSAANAGAPPAETLARSTHVIVLVPAEDVLLLNAPAVSQQRAQLAKALPYAIEERLASPVEDLLIALPDEIHGDSIGVAVVARATLARWKELLAARAIRADLLVPETLALPVAAGASTLLIDGERALLRTDATQASACDLRALPAWTATIDAPLEVFDFRVAAPLALDGNVLRYHERQRDVLAFLAAHLPAKPALNLLQGEFASTHRQLPAQRLWRIAAALAAAALLLSGALAGGDWMRKSAESRRLDATMREVLHTSFPGLDNVAGDPQQLMRSEIARLRGAGEGTALLRVLGEVAPILGSSSRIMVRGIEYHNATLELSLRAPDVEALDLVRERLSGLDGINAVLTAADRNDNGVDGRLRITLVKS